MASDRREGKAAHPAAPVGRAFQPIVVQHNRLTVGGEPNIELDPAAAERLRLTEAGEGVFGRARGSTAMTDYRRQDFSALPADPG